jgi:hypothetical protein
VTHGGTRVTQHAYKPWMWGAIDLYTNALDTEYQPSESTHDTVSVTCQRDTEFQPCLSCLVCRHCSQPRGARRAENETFADSGRALGWRAVRSGLCPSGSAPDECGPRSLSLSEY